MTEPAISSAGGLPSLKDAEWLKRPETKRVFAALSGDGVQTRAVGGAVRDTLLGEKVKEIDLATTAKPEQVMALAKKAGLKLGTPEVMRGPPPTASRSVSLSEAIGATARSDKFA